MAKYVYMRGFSAQPYNTIRYMTSANALLDNIYSLGLSAEKVDIEFYGNMVILTAVYDAITPIDNSTVFPI